MSRLLRPLLAGSFVVAALPSLASAQPAMPAPAVGTIEVHRAPVVETSEYVGRVQAVDSVALIARVTAFLEQRLFTEGSEVTKGQLLYVLEQPPFQATVEADQGTLLQAQANAAFAVAQLNRQQNLLNTPAGQRSTFDQAQATQRGDTAAVLSAEANLKAAQINLGYTEIRAPIDGRITATALNEGNVVNPTSGTLATIVSQDPMYVVFPVAERDLEALRRRYAKAGGLVHVAIRVRLSDGDVYGQDGHLDYVAPTVSNSTDTITLRATIANPKREGADSRTGDRALVSGQFVTVLIQAPQPISLITIPQSAVLSDQQGSYVFVVAAGDVARRTNIATGEQAGTNVAVLSGLADGSTIITDGLQRVRDGGKVHPGPPPAAAVPPGEAPGGNPPKARGQTNKLGTAGNPGNGGGASGRGQ